MNWRKKVILNDKSLQKRVANLEISLIEKNATIVWLKNQVRLQNESIRRLESKLYPIYDAYHRQKKFLKELGGP